MLRPAGLENIANRKLEMKEAKPNPCIACPGHCCFRNLINVCGYDAWLVARELAIEPTDFLAFAYLQQEKTPYNFHLDGSGKSYLLSLYMNECPDGSRRCIFALNLPHGQLRCGIYPLRPIACQGYPFVLDEGEVAVKPWALCPQDTWNLADLDLASLKEEMGRFDMEFSIYGLVVASWNKHVAQHPPLEKLDFRPFVNYMMDVYDELQRARAEVPSDAWHEIWNRWRESEASGVNQLEFPVMESEPPAWGQWLQSIHRAVEDTVSRRFAFHKMMDEERTTEVCCV